MTSLKSLTVIGVCIAATLPVAAADLPPRAPTFPGNTVAPVRTDSVNWTGFYLGIHGGGARGNSSWSDPFNGLADTVSSTGFLAGGQVGYNYQIGNFVIGAEGDFSWTNLNGNNTDAGGNNHNTGVDWTSTITARLGVAKDRWLAYGKGGVAFAYDNSSLTDLLGNTATGVTTRIGWTAGAGVEYALTAQWSARLEYDYLAFGARDVDLTGSALGTGTGNVGLEVHQIKAGANFRF